MLLRSLLVQAMRKNGLGDQLSKDLLKNFEESLMAAKRQAQQERDAAEQVAHSSYLMRVYYRNKYREGGDCLDIEDRGWVV